MNNPKAIKLVKLQRRLNKVDCFTSEYSMNNFFFVYGIGSSKTKQTER